MLFAEQMRSWVLGVKKDPTLRLTQVFSLCYGKVNTRRRPTTRSSLWPGGASRRESCVVSSFGKIWTDLYCEECIDKSISFPHIFHTLWYPQCTHKSEHLEENTMSTQFMKRVPLTPLSALKFGRAGYSTFPEPPRPPGPLASPSNK